VPAGNPDGGQWTDSGGGGGGINDARILSDATPDNEWKPGARYAQNDQLDYRVDLSENTHVIQQHVRSREYVLRRVREIAQRAEGLGDDFEGLRAGSFSSLEAANKLVNSTLAQNQTVVDQVVSGARSGVRIEARFGTSTGYEAYMARPHSQAELRDTYGVRVVIQHDPLARHGFRIITAFPVR